ncbi:MAG TPA: hypothetical protein VFT66_26610 [Roseiflexaceae bacterium]|nr:hypothetical protein [Roseiflexaceae bacterium]
MSLTDYQSLFSMLASAGTTLALIIGGWWSWRLFVRKRISYPRARIEHAVSHKKAFYQKTMLIVDISIANVSEVLLTLRSGKTYVRQLLPIPEDVVHAVQASSIPAKDQAHGWNLVAFQPEDWGDEPLLLEPGEAEHLFYTFFIDANVQTVAIYSYFPYVEQSGLRWFKRQPKQLGWSLTTVHDCHAPDNTAKDRHVQTA